MDFIWLQETRKGVGGIKKSYILVSCHGNYLSLDRWGSQDDQPRPKTKKGWSGLVLMLTVLPLSWLKLNNTRPLRGHWSDNSTKLVFLNWKESIIFGDDKIFLKAKLNIRTSSRFGLSYFCLLCCIFKCILGL